MPPPRPTRPPENRHTTASAPGDAKANGLQRAAWSWPPESGVAASAGWRWPESAAKRSRWRFTKVYQTGVNRHGTCGVKDTWQHRHASKSLYVETISHRYCLGYLCVWCIRPSPRCKTSSTRCHSHGCSPCGHQDTRSDERNTGSGTQGRHRHQGRQAGRSQGQARSQEGRTCRQEGQACRSEGCQSRCTGTSTCQAVNKHERVPYALCQKAIHAMAFFYSHTPAYDKCENQLLLIQ